MKRSNIAACLHRLVHPLVLALLLPLVPGSGCSVFHASVTRRYREAVAAGPYDAIIVPGFPSRNGKWNRVLQARICWSRELYRDGVARHIIYSGAAAHSPYVEAEVMALYARALGVPAQIIVTETNALHSSENLLYSYELARRLGWQKLAVASDPIQTPHLRRLARRFGIRVTFLPVDFVRLARIPKEEPRIETH